MIWHAETGGDKAPGSDSTPIPIPAFCLLMPCGPIRELRERPALELNRVCSTRLAGVGLRGPNRVRSAPAWPFDCVGVLSHLLGPKSPFGDAANLRLAKVQKSLFLSSRGFGAPHI